MSRVLILVVVACLAAGAWAQRAADPAAQVANLVAQSEVVAVVAIDTVTMPELPKTVAYTEYFRLRNMTVEATAKVEKVLKGTFAAPTLPLQLRIMLEGPMPKPNGTMKPTGWSPALAAGQRYIVGLIETKQGMTPRGGQIPATDALIVAATDAIAKPQMQATIAAPAGALTIGADAAWTITVKNTGATVIEVTAVTISGFYRMDSLNDNIYVSGGGYYMNSRMPETANPGPLATVDPGAEATITLTKPVPGPANIALFDAKFFPLKASLIATLTAREKTADNKGAFRTCLTNRIEVSLDKLAAK